MLPYRLLLFLCFYEITTSTAKINERIIGGVPASIYQYPYAAAINVTTSTSIFFCGGTLYNRDYVLTAGQCVNGAVLFEVHLGSAQLSDPNRLTLATSEYILHPDFNPQTLANDIGLIKFRMSIEYSDTVKPIHYLAINDIGTHKIRAIGWGQASDDDSALSDQLNYIYVSPVSNTACRNTYGGQILDSMVCVEGNFNEGSCHGDTGSPLIDLYAQYYEVHVGVASFMSGNGCESTDPSGYTRTLPYVSWIKNVTGT